MMRIIRKVFWLYAFLVSKYLSVVFVLGAPQVEELRLELNKKEQEVLALGAKMKTLEEQHQDYQRHIAVLKESLCAKEEHHNMLQADVRTRLIRISSALSLGKGV